MPIKYKFKLAQGHMRVGSISSQGNEIFSTFITRHSRSGNKELKIRFPGSLCSTTFGIQREDKKSIIYIKRPKYFSVKVKKSRRLLSSMNTLKLYFNIQNILLLK